MKTQPSSLNDKIAKLRATFIAQLPGRMAEARTLLDLLRTSPDNAEAARSLHRYLHSLKGTGASFGFPNLSKLAGQGEHQAKTILEHRQQLTESDWQSLAQCLNEMDALVAGAVHNDAATTPADQQIPFEIPHTSAHKNKAYDKERLIYICDDEVLQAQQMGAQLECFGYRIKLFNTTAELLAAAQKKPPDAIIMDIMFPDSADEGTKVLIELRRTHHTEFPVIFISARRDFEARLAAIRAGGEAYFPKPVAALELVATLDQLTRQHPPEAFRILIVDDEPEIAQYHALILENAGMVTQITHDLETVLNVVGEFRPDLVLMDMYMPQASGQEIAKLIRQIPEHVALPIMFLSSETDRDKQFFAMRTGAEDFLTKPILPDVLVSSVAIRAERTRTLRSLMAHDSLTGLLNHTTTTQFLTHNIVTARRQHSSFCFAMIDVDHFKSVNDTYGHLIGDQVLLALARVLQQRLRNSDLVGRYGGEEFAVIMNDVSLAEAGEIMDELREDFSKVVFNAGKQSFSCSFSCGVAAFPHLNSMESLREAADKAMYQAKHAGRNRVVVYGG